MAQEQGRLGRLTQERASVGEKQHPRYLRKFDHVVEDIGKYEQPTKVVDRWILHAIMVVCGNPVTQPQSTAILQGADTLVFIAEESKFLHGHRAGFRRYVIELE